MWTKLAHIIIKYRLPLILTILGVTVFMGFQAKKVQMSYKFAKVVPEEHPEMKYFLEFGEKFGADDNVMALAIENKKLYQLETFKNFKKLCEELAKIEGIDSGVVALPVLQKLTRNDRKKRFDLKPIFEPFPSTQKELDEKLALARSIQFYKNLVFKDSGNTTVLILAVQPEYFNSKYRKELMKKFMSLTEAFEKDNDIRIHYAGIPYVRTNITEMVSGELKLLLAMSLLVLAIILFLFFRSFSVVIFSVLVIGVSVIWTVGTLALFGFKITLVSGLIPPIIVVIGIPNCVYLINKYHQEFDKTGKKIKALSRVIRRIGIVTLITNLTTSVGFLVLSFNDIDILREFGIVAGINILGTFIISMVLIPSIFSYLPPPTPRQLKHLEFKALKKVIDGLVNIVMNYRKTVYIVTIIVVIVCSWGSWLMHTVSYMVDDIPEDSRIKVDLKFFEKEYKGIMPLELVVQPYKRNPSDTNSKGEFNPIATNYEELVKQFKDTTKFLIDKNGYSKTKNLARIDQLSTYLEEHKSISKPISILNFLKASKQAYFNDDPKLYSVPEKRDARVLRYIRNTIKKGKRDAESKFKEDSAKVVLPAKYGNIKNLADVVNEKEWKDYIAKIEELRKKYNSQSTFLYEETGEIRVSLKIADLGSKNLARLLEDEIIPKADSVFSNQYKSKSSPNTYLEYHVTGTTPLFVKGNQFLIINLRWSLVIAFIVIAFVMGALFGSLRMIIISFIPNIIPLLITGALMGYFNIPLKPSTALIFTIAFGISVDDSIHYLAKYRQEMFLRGFIVKDAVSISLRETGSSMIYTSVILFFGFIMFGISDFQGTIMLGILTSTTLLIAMFTNLIVLPSLLMTFDYQKRKRAGKNSLLIDQFNDDFYEEGEDEEIDLKKLEVDNNNSKN